MILLLLGSGAGNIFLALQLSVERHGGQDRAIELQIGTKNSSRAAVSFLFTRYLLEHKAAILGERKMFATCFCTIFGGNCSVAPPHCWPAWKRFLNFYRDWERDLRKRDSPPTSTITHLCSENNLKRKN